MVRSGEGFGAHYSALLSNQQEPSLDEPTLDPTFSPEVVKSHPRAPPRAENTRGRRKWKSAVLTDTPVKNALRDEQRTYTTALENAWHNGLTATIVGGTHTSILVEKIDSDSFLF